MEGYTEMEGFHHRVPVSSVPSDSAHRNSTETSSDHRTRLLQTASNLDVPVIPETSVSSSFVASDRSIPPYHGSTTGRYSGHLSEVPTSGYTFEAARFPIHLPSSTVVSAYDPRSYTYHQGGFPGHQRQELSLNYGHMSQPYVGHSHQASLRTDTETYNAALALVESQNKIFTDDSGGQYFQLDSTTGSSDNPNYEVIHAHLVDNSTQNINVGTDVGQVEKVIYVTEKPHNEIQQTAESMQPLGDKLSENIEQTPESHIEVIIETVEMEDTGNKPNELQDNTLQVPETDNTRGHTEAQLNESSECKSKKEMNASDLKELVSGVPKHIVEHQERVTSAAADVTKTYKDTASQIGGPDLESRFGVLLEELKDTPSGKACCIQLKPINHVDLQGLYNSIFFDMEIDNELQVSPIEKTVLTEKSSRYTFYISTHKDSEPKVTSRKDIHDKTLVTVKSDETSDVVVKDVKTAIKEVTNDLIMTRARKRKMARPLKIPSQKKLSKPQNQKVKVQSKFNSKHKKESKQTKSKLKSRSSKELKSADHSNYDDDDDADRYDDYDVNDNTVTKDCDYKEVNLDTNEMSNMAESVSEVVIKDENKDRSEHDQTRSAKKKKKKHKVERNTDNDSEMSSNKDDDVVVKETDIEKELKAETDSSEGQPNAVVKSKPKRKYERRTNYNKTEINYSVRKTESGRVFVCNICSYESKQTGNMRSHMRCRHTEEKPFECDICHKQFSSQSNLRGHWSIHKDERPYLCSICGTAFKANSNLQKHIMRHLGDKRFSCKTCGKQFVTSTDLRRHYRVHSAEKAFLCDLCPKGFKDGTSLSRHRFCHTGLKNHLCSFCGEAFARKDNCYTHMKKHHSHESDILPLPIKRLEHYVNSPEQTEEEAVQETKQKPVKPQPEPVVVAENVEIDDTHIESQMPPLHIGKPEGTYTHLMAVDELPNLTKLHVNEHQQYEMYIPISMQGPSW